MRAASLSLIVGFLATMSSSAHAAEPPKILWAESTGSPRAEPAADARDSELLALCGAGDASLHAVAARLAAGSLSASNAEALVYALRAAGAPYVRPHAWTLRGVGLERSAARERLSAWLGKFRDGGERRCGIASNQDEAGKRSFAAVVVDAKADLAPIPLRTRVSDWITIEARTRASASSAKVIVLGPTGPPQPILTSFSGGKARARFRVDRPGAWRAQLLLNDDLGPRPALEFLVFAGVRPPAHQPLLEAPGEETQVDEQSDELTLERMVNAARTSERLAPLFRDPSLDEVAKDHARRMLVAGKAAHDLGEGQPHQRLNAAGIFARAIGENLAHAANVKLAHRALWASPSHRGNLLDPRFTRFGLAVLKAPDGSVWVAQVFTSN